MALRKYGTGEVLGTEQQPEETESITTTAADRSWDDGDERELTDESKGA